MQVPSQVRTAHSGSLMIMAGLGTSRPSLAMLRRATGNSSYSQKCGNLPASCRGFIRSGLLFSSSCSRLKRWARTELAPRQPTLRSWLRLGERGAKVRAHEAGPACHEHPAHRCHSGTGTDTARASTFAGILEAGCRPT